jgi:hypothetical protein
MRPLSRASTAAHDDPMTAIQPVVGEGASGEGGGDNDLAAEGLAPADLPKRRSTYPGGRIIRDTDLLARLTSSREERRTREFRTVVWAGLASGFAFGAFEIGIGASPGATVWTPADPEECDVIPGADGAIVDAR